VSVADVAVEVVSRDEQLHEQDPASPPMTARRLQFLLYASQGWSLAARGRALFSEPIYADPEGPRSRPIWDLTRDLDIVTRHVLCERLAHPCTPSQVEDMRAMIARVCDADSSLRAQWEVRVLDRMSVLIRCADAVAHLSGVSL
jgi:uncharacterized phage-associated protein